MAEIDAQTAAVTALSCTFDEASWHPTLEDALEGLTSHQAAWKPHADRHSIHELVVHLVHWKKAVLDEWRPFTSREAFDAYHSRDWPPMETTPESWERDAEELRQVSKSLLDATRQAALENLLTPPTGRETPPALGLIRVATHDAYHVGQMMYLRKLQGV